MYSHNLSFRDYATPSSADVLWNSYIVSLFRRGIQKIPCHGIICSYWQSYLVSKFRCVYGYLTYPDYTQLLDRYNSILTRNTALYALQNLKHVNQNVLFMRLSVTDCFDWCWWWGIICCFSNDFDFKVGRLFVPSSLCH